MYGSGSEYDSQDEMHLFTEMQIHKVGKSGVPTWYIHCPFCYLLLLSSIASLMTLLAYC